MQDIQLVDCNAVTEDGSTAKVTLDKCFDNVEALKSFYKQDLKSKSNQYVEKLQRLENEIDKRQKQIDISLDAVVPHEELEGLRKDQSLKISEHESTIKELQEFCQSQGQVSEQLMLVQKAVLSAETRLQERDWALSHAFSTITELKKNIKAKEVEYQNLCGLLELKTKEIENLKSDQ